MTSVNPDSLVLELNPEYLNRMNALKSDPNEDNYRTYRMLSLMKQREWLLAYFTWGRLFETAKEEEKTPELTYAYELATTSFNMKNVILADRPSEVWFILILLTTLGYNC